MQHYIDILTFLEFENLNLAFEIQTDGVILIFAFSVVVFSCICLTLFKAVWLTAGRFDGIAEYEEPKFKT